MVRCFREWETKCEAKKKEEDVNHLPRYPFYLQNQATFLPQQSAHLCNHKFFNNNIILKVIKIKDTILILNGHLKISKIRNGTEKATCNCNSSVSS